MSARARYIPKKHGEGRSAVWRIYDLQMGSLPIQRPDLGGLVNHTHKTEAEAQAECDRLYATYGGMNEKPSRKTVARASSLGNDPEDGDDAGGSDEIEPDDDPEGESDDE